MLFTIHHHHLPTIMPRCARRVMSPWQTFGTELPLLKLYRVSHLQMRTFLPIQIHPLLAHMQYGLTQLHKLACTHTFIVQASSLPPPSLSLSLFFSLSLSPSLSLS